VDDGEGASTRAPIFFDVDVWDRDAIGSDDFLGRARVNVARDGTPVRQWHALVGAAGAEDGVPRGRIELYSVWRHSPGRTVKAPARARSENHERRSKDRERRRTS
jgi:hypothetical protein